MHFAASHVSSRFVSASKRQKSEMVLTTDSDETGGGPAPPPPPPPPPKKVAGTSRSRITIVPATGTYEYQEAVERIRDPVLL